MSEVIDRLRQARADFQLIRDRTDAAIAALDAIIEDVETVGRRVIALAAFPEQPAAGTA